LTKAEITAKTTKPLANDVVDTILGGTGSSPCGSLCPNRGQEKHNVISDNAGILPLGKMYFAIKRLVERKDEGGRSYGSGGVSVRDAATADHFAPGS
jgi:hypothetical protein